MWSGSVWVRVWIGPEVNPNVCACYSLDGPWKGKGSCAGSKCTAWLLRRRTTCNRVRLAVSQPGGATIAAWLLHCFALQQVQLRNLTAWQRGFTTICLGRLEWRIAAGHQTQKHATITGPHINSPIQYIVPKIKCGSPRFDKKKLDRV